MMTSMRLRSRIIALLALVYFFSCEFEDYLLKAAWVKAAKTRVLASSTTMRMLGTFPQYSITAFSKLALGNR